MSKLILGAEVYSVVNAAWEVLSKLGHGFHEKPYENALVVELGLRGISCLQQRCFKLVYKGIKGGEYIPDLIVHGMIIIEPKVIDRISDHERGRMINYLRTTGFPVGLILNFRRAKLEWERIILTDPEPGMDAITHELLLLLRVHSRLGWRPVKRTVRWIQHEGQTLFGLVGTGARKYGSASRRNWRSRRHGNDRSYGRFGSSRHSHSLTRDRDGSYLCKTRFSGHKIRAYLPTQNGRSPQFARYRTSNRHSRH